MIGRIPNLARMMEAKDPYNGFWADHSYLASNRAFNLPKSTIITTT